MFEFKVTMFNLDKPNQNGYIFTKEAIDNVVDQLQDYSVPVRLYEEYTDFDFRQLIGRASVEKYNYPQISFNGQIVDDAFKSLFTQNKVQLTLQGSAQFDGISVISLRFKGLSAVEYSGQVSTIEVKENENDT